MIEEVLNELTGLAKPIFDNGVIDQEQRLTITYDAIPEKEWNIRGRGFYGDAHLKRSSSFKFANPAESLPIETVETNRQFRVVTREMFGDVTFTKDFLVRLTGGETSFADYIFKIEDLIRSQRKNMNQSCYIGPRMIRTAVTVGGVLGATSVTVANIQYLFAGMHVDFYNAAGTLLTAGNVEIESINSVTGVLTTSPLPAAVNATDTVFLHEENLGAGTTGKGFVSLPFQADDGTDFPVDFEEISRVTFSAWRGNRIDVTGAPLTNDILQRGQNTLYEQAGNDYMTEDYVNFVHPNSVRRYIAIILPQKRYVNAQKYDSGMEKPGMLEWNGKPIFVDPDCSKADWYMVNRAHSGKKELYPIGIEKEFNNAAMKWKSGFMQGITVTYFSGNLGNDKPNSTVVIKNLAAV